MVTHYESVVTKGKKKIRTGGHRDVGEVPEKPFLRPAAAESGQAAVDAFSDEMTDALVTGTDWASVGGDAGMLEEEVA
jgi:hypothetical protein